MNVVHPFSDFVISSPLSPFDDSEPGTIYLYLGAGPDIVVSDSYTQVSLLCVCACVCIEVHAHRDVFIDMIYYCV